YRIARPSVRIRRQKLNHGTLGLPSNPIRQPRDPPARPPNKTPPLCPRNQVQSAQLSRRDHIQSIRSRRPIGQVKPIAALHIVQASVVGGLSRLAFPLCLFLWHSCLQWRFLVEGAPPQRGTRPPPPPPALGSAGVRRDLATPPEWRRARAAFCLPPS